MHEKRVKLETCMPAKVPVKGSRSASAEKVGWVKGGAGREREHARIRSAAARPTQCCEQRASERRRKSVNREWRMRVDDTT
eukprot:6211842-Pleurochrysis_carterae.AAC.3